MLQLLSDDERHDRLFDEQFGSKLVNQTFDDFRPIVHDENIFELRVPCFKSKIFLFLEKPTSKKLRKFTRLPKSYIGKYIGHKYSKAQGRACNFDDYRIMIISVNDENALSKQSFNYEHLATLSHELLHAAFFLIDEYSSQYKEESLCHLQDYLLASSIFAIQHGTNQDKHFLPDDDLLFRSIIMTDGTFCKKSRA